MKKILPALLLLASLSPVMAKTKGTAPDSVYLFAYASVKNNNHGGLHFAWSRDKANWFDIGNEYDFVKSDYGRWGSEKRMITPYIIVNNKGVWHCLWSLNERDKTFAHTASTDLVDWGRQSYPTLQWGKNCLEPVLAYNAKTGTYTITYTDSEHQYYQLTTTDFKRYSQAVKVPAAKYHNSSLTADLPAGKQCGQVYRVAWPLVENLIKTAEVKKYRDGLYSETTKQDGERFKDLKPLTASVKIQPEKARPISDMLLGAFFEDLNYAADGGLYAELIQNRDFEYQPGDKDGRDKAWISTHSWTVKGNQSEMQMDSVSPIHINNKHYAVLTTQKPGAALVNSGFDGIVVKKGQNYNLSLFARQLSGANSALQVCLVDADGNTLAETKLDAANANWKKLSAVLSPNANAEHAVLEIRPLTAGKLALDVVSLFPQNTFNGRANGLRADLAQTIAGIHPRFIRFPGGCVAHGDGLGNIYRWKNTIGPVETRKPQRNLWGYHQSAGLGYFEYFQFCEDIGAAPVPVLAAGVPCQNSGTGGAGQQGGIPMAQMDEYVQDVLDLVEYANGDVTTTWGKKRAEAGHPKPFNLKYIGIGNEDLITDIFEERFTMIYKAMRKAHPEITVIGTVGPFYEGTDYEQGWGIANKLKVPMVDEHYYQPPGWFIYNQDFYDSYDRSKSKVYLGEYAAHLPGRPNNLETALSEALYMTSLERNGDVLSMASYAPLLAKEGHTQWNPDLIYFNNTEVKPTVGYFVQQLYGANLGDRYLPNTLALSSSIDAVKKRVAVSVVRDSKTNDVIVKMVNLLPVKVSADLDMAGIDLNGKKVSKTILQGDPSSKTTRPETSEISGQDAGKSVLPAYSFTVLRFAAK